MAKPTALSFFKTKRRPERGGIKKAMQSNICTTQKGVIMPRPKARADGLLERTVTDKRTGKRVHFYGHTVAEINRKMMEYTKAAERGRLFKDLVAGLGQDGE